MAGRRAGNAANRIRGPQSALTDFLAANNISAQQIRDSYDQRNQTARQQNATATPASASNAASNNAPSADRQEIDDELSELTDLSDLPVSASSKKKRKRAEDNKKPVKKIKKVKKGKKKGPDDDSDDDFDLTREMYKKSVSKPGQLDNCEVCEKRFTVTAYSKTGPSGGLLCSPCGRDLAKERDSGVPKPKRAAVGKGRRKAESNKLDGLVTHGAKSLQQICIEKVADHHLDIEEFGDLPETVLDRLSEIFSKRRVIDSRTFRLFLRPDLDTINVHDCAKLESDDYKQIFAIVPNVSKLVLANACQFKDHVVEYMLDKAPGIKHLKLYGANLVTNEMWVRYMEQQGPKLESLQLQWMDASFNDEVVEALAANCTSLRRLKLKMCRQITDASLPQFAKLKGLQHLSLHFSHPVAAEALIELITVLGPTLQTLSLENCADIDDTVVHAIRTSCRRLAKLRLTPLDSVTDAALSALFGASPNAEPTVLPPLHFLDLNSARDVDNSNPDGPVDAPIGLASESFKALMLHSGAKLQRLQIPSCRHISNAALWEVFIGSGKNPKASEMTYPDLLEINCSFVPAVDTSIITGMFQACPKLKKIVAFGCFHIEDVKVPGGVALIGVPRAQDAIEKFGDAGTAIEESFLGKLMAVGTGVGGGREIEVGA